jgi:hypothetical protein
VSAGTRLQSLRGLRGAAAALAMLGMTERGCEPLRCCEAAGQRPCASWRPQQACQQKLPARLYIVHVVCQRNCHMSPALKVDRLVQKRQAGIVFCCSLICGSAVVVVWLRSVVLV